MAGNTLPKIPVITVETSGDGRRWGTVAEGRRVYAVKGIPEARRTAVRYPLSDSRWVRVTLLAGSGPPPRILGARVVRAAVGPPPLDALEVRVTASAGPDGRSTRFDLDLAAPGLPVAEVRLEVEDAAFERAARALASADGRYWTPAGGGLLWRAPGAGGAREDLENVRLSVRPEGRRWLRVGFPLLCIECPLHILAEPLERFGQLTNVKDLVLVHGYKGECRFAAA